jgi:hypothetical protein
MIDEPFDNPHHGHGAMPREVVLYPHEWGGTAWNGPAMTATAYLGPTHPDDKEGVRYVPAEAGEALAEAVRKVILEARATTDATENVRKLWWINKVLCAAAADYRDASRESVR